MEFTNFKIEASNKKAVKTAAELKEELRALLGEESDEQNVLVQEDSTAVFSKLNSALADKGVIFTDFATAVREHGELLKKNISSAKLCK